MWRPLKSATKIGKYRGRRVFIAALPAHGLFFSCKELDLLFAGGSAAAASAHEWCCSDCSAAQSSAARRAWPRTHSRRPHPPSTPPLSTRSCSQIGRGVRLRSAGSFQPAMHVQLHAQPRVKHARLKMRGQGWRSARHVHVSVRLCATRGTGERTIGGDKDSIGDGRMWFRT